MKKMTMWLTVEENYARFLKWCGIIGLVDFASMLALITVDVLKK
ncbi:hypothetical protein PQR64_02920 [Paraburkholderia phytofirmans]